MAGAARYPLGSAEAPGEPPRGRANRILAPGRGGDRREGREARASAKPGRRPALCAYHFARHGHPGRKRCRGGDPHGPEPAQEVRALLALARRRRRRFEAPGDLRALRAEPLRRGRAPAIRVIPANLKRIVPRLLLAALLAIAEQASKYA